MIKVSCVKCRVIIPKKMSTRLYGTHRVCKKCDKEWSEEFKRLKVIHYKLDGWRAWKPVFLQWLDGTKKEKVMFT